MALYIPAPEGDKSPGVAPGGLENQVLRKASDLNYDTEWADVNIAGGIGPAGPAGATGATGPAGPGVPTGGTAGQVLTKVSTTNYDSAWQTPNNSAFAGGTLTSNLTLAAGTTSLSPLTLQSGTNLTTAAAGAIEYDGKVMYSTPAGRGVSPSMMFYRLNSALAGSNVNTAQSIFGVGVTLQSSTVYAFEMVATFTKTAGTTSHTFYVGFDGGTATFNNFFANQLSSSVQGAPSTNTNLSLGSVYIGTVNSATEFGGLVSIAGATRTLPFFYNGTFSISSGGTFLPRYRMSAAPGGAYSTMAGSFICIYPIGASGSNTSVGPWA